ncbi:membrane dipeptidase-domain-containing protein [Chytriomyces sp. MP71]|nr:membrane dipeptidase-domain-containing protein [Chytriomyces sp. MP71]
MSQHEKQALLGQAPPTRRSRLNYLRRVVGHIAPLLLLALVLFILASGPNTAAKVEPWTPSRNAVPPSRGESPMHAALRILEYAPIIDGHNDLPLRLLYKDRDNLKDLDLSHLPEADFQTDIYRLKKGRVGAQFWSAYVACSDFNKQTDSVRETLDQIDRIKRLVHYNPETFTLALSSNDIRAAYHEGKIASLIGIEGAHQIDASMGALRTMHALGVRYMTLTHTCHSAWADSCGPPPLHGGITADGHRFIREMNRLGMLVDISHVSPDTMRQTIQASHAPTFFSHSSAYTLTRVPRNVPDDVLALLPAHDGLVMVNFIAAFVARNGSSEAGVTELADHVEHIRATAGAKHVGLGADFDGGPVDDFALKDVGEYPLLVAELIQRGWTEKEIVGLTGGNLLRVLQRVERVAVEMQQAGIEWEEVGIKVEKVC